MSIPGPVRDNFQVLLRAAENGDLALLECSDADTGQARYVICAVSREDGEFQFAPFGHMVSDRNPYEAYIPLGAHADGGPDRSVMEPPNGAA